jgi:arylsulfatase A-like enzyme
MASLSSSGGLAAGRPAAERPNVLFVFADQFRADLCGVYGDKALKNITTPHLDRLAAQGVTFAHALSTAPKCTPFRGMLMTGRYPTHTGLVVNFVHASAKQNPNCIANVFARGGYDTGFIGKWHLAAGGWRNPGRKPQPDTAENFVPPGPGRLGFDYWAANNFHVDFNDYWYYRDEDKKLFSERYETDTQIDQAIEFMSERKRSSRPFFLVVAPHPPHPPFRKTHIPEGYLEKVPEDLKWSPNVPEEVKERHKERLRYYLAMSKNIDDNIGRLTQFLDESGLAENTIVVFTSDHGEMHGSHNRYNKKVPYAESVNIPLIMRWPSRIPVGRRADDLYTPMDHLPTLCNLCGLAAPPEVDGISLKDVVLGRGSSGRKAVLMGTYVSHYNTFTTGKPYLEWRGVHTGRYTYCKWIRQPAHTDTDEELYDNYNDPYQMKNLVRSEECAGMLNDLRKTLKELLAKAHDEFLPGTAYAEWYDEDRNLIRTALGPVGG